jgi:hypothetical protein
MATSREMRKFAADCLRWSAETKNASHRDLMKQMAKSWTKTASAIERRVQGRELELPDLRSKLN